jgi:hypothetical protein
MPGQRKSIEPMAKRLGVDAQSLQQFENISGSSLFSVEWHRGA